MIYPNSAQLVALAKAATEMTEELLQRGYHAGVLRKDAAAIRSALRVASARCWST
jgi:hypothetical protein